MRIIGYVFCAAGFCPACTRDAYESGELEIDRNRWRDLQVGTDENGLPDALTHESGDDVGIITSLDEGEFICDTCGEELE